MLLLFSCLFLLVFRVDLSMEVESHTPKPISGPLFEPIDAGSVVTYAATVSKLVIYFIRRLEMGVGEDVNLPPLRDDVHEQARNVMNAPSKTTLHALFLGLFNPENIVDNGRDSHTLGDFLKLSSVRVNSFASVDSISHSAVHLIYLAKLVVFPEIANNEDADRDHLLQRVHLQYAGLLSVAVVFG